MAFRFLPHETAEMEQMLLDNNFRTPSKKMIEAIADRFCAARATSGHKPIVWKQVWNWFQNKRHNMRNKGLITSRAKRSSSEEPFGTSRPVGGPASDATPISLEALAASMDFEAKSLRDAAWYDVEAFGGCRKNPAGEQEVRVQFAGFSEEESEWVNAKTAVRQRSLPCEATECVAVLPQDLVLCFQEANDQALYFDADILDVQRRRHDVRGCRCRFWVRYRHDGNEEVVPLRKICRRPDTEYRLQAAQQAQAAANARAAGAEAAIGLPGRIQAAPALGNGPTAISHAIGQGSAAPSASASAMS